MNERKALRERTQKRHRRDKSVIDHLVGGEAGDTSKGTTHGPETESGRSVQEQVRKEWTPDKGGLPTF